MGELIMNIRCNLEIDFKSTDDVKKVAKSVKVDDLDFVNTKIIGKKLVGEVNSNSISSLLHTLDDYLACVSVASKILDKK